jgi:hypothetical protein
VAACTAAAFAFAFLSWGNPYLANGFDVRLAIVPDTANRTMYGPFFGLTYLAPGRLLNVLVLVVAAYAFLTAYWKSVARPWLVPDSPGPGNPVRLHHPRGADRGDRQHPGAPPG